MNYQENEKQTAAAYNEFAAKQMKPFRTVSDAGCGNSQRPSGPTVRDMACETFSALENAHAELDRIFAAVDGTPGPSGAKERDTPSGLKGMLACSAELAQMLVGRLATLNAAI